MLTIPSITGVRLTRGPLADVPESVDLSHCYNLRTLSIRTQGCSQRLATSLAAQERFFQLLRTIESYELEFLVVEMGPEFSIMQYRTWGYLFKEFYALQASRKRLSVIVDPYERFMAGTFKKGEVLARFLGCGRERG